VVRAVDVVLLVVDVVLLVVDVVLLVVVVVASAVMIELVFVAMDSFANGRINGPKCRESVEATEGTRCETRRRSLRKRSRRVVAAALGGKGKDVWEKWKEVSVGRLVPRTSWNE